VSRAYVICAACGARIRADRGRCLRCGEPLKAAASAPPPLPTLRAWLQGSNPRHLAIGAVASLAVLVGVVMFVDPGASRDRVGRPTPGAAKRNVQGGPADAAYVPPQGEAMLPVTAFDSTRLGGAALIAGDLDSAKARYEEALGKKADDPEALNGLGLVLEREGQTDDAIARFQKAADAVPKSWAYRFNLAHALGERGDWDHAITEYRVAAGLFPDDYATQFNLAMALHKKGDEEGAVAEFTKAITLAPGEPSFHLALAISLEKTGKTADAQREYQQYLDMAPSTPDAEKLRAHIKALASGQPAADAKSPATP
jgi:Flp pilus assembly protein TadD